ncbi:hypothetical protein [Agrobacterium tumefaciens]|nr:hypothetical protein [Agrobacterium tumefaciens]
MIKQAFSGILEDDDIYAERTSSSPSAILIDCLPVRIMFGDANRKTMMAIAILLKTCKHCGRPHEREGEDFSAGRFCNACSADRRAIAAAVLKARPVTKSEILASGKYLKRSSGRA